MTNEYDWLLKKSQRSVNNLHLWKQNPRLDPENAYITIKDFADEVTSSSADRTSFLDLVKSIATRGFIPADPVVIWYNSENKKFYVAEGNRRLLATKLLLNPSSAPKSIKGTISKLAKGINKNDYKKIPVSVAPNFEDAEWYISQRNSISSLQKKWSTEQQRRWISELYDKYDGNIDIIKSKIDITESDLQSVIRILKLKSKVREVKDKLTEEEYSRAASHTFPLTTLDRFFGFTAVREAWNIDFDGYDVVIKSEYDSFLQSFSQLIKRILLPRGEKGRIDSRTIRTSEQVKTVLESLPQTTLSDNHVNISESPASPVAESTSNGTRQPSNDGQQAALETTVQKGDPNRNRLITNNYTLKTDNYKMGSLFKELQTIPLKYNNSIAAAIRVFLDLAVRKFIETENYEGEMCQLYKLSLKDIPLKKRLEFLKQKITDQKINNVLSKLLNPSNDFSLDVLNGYVHSDDNHFSSPEFLNRFWDFLFPLFEKMLEINVTNR
jgi:hypothetical protein